MTTVPHHWTPHWPHRHRDRSLGGDLRPGTVLAGLAALIALVALVGGLAGAATWAVLQLISVALD